MAKATKTQTKVQPKFKAYISDYTIVLETLLVRGRVVNICKPKTDKPKFRYCSPEDGNPVEQFYQDTVTGKLYKVEDLNKVHDTSADEAVVLTADALKELRESQLPKNVLNIAVFPSSDVDKLTYPCDTNGFVFQPDAGVPQNILYSQMLVAAIEENPHYALLGMCNFHGHEGLFRLDTWRGNLSLHKLNYPGDVNDHPVREHNIDAKGVKAISAMLDKLAKPFDPAAFDDITSKRIFAALADPDAFNASQEADEDDEQDVVTDVESVLSSLGLS